MECDIPREFTKEEMESIDFLNQAISELSLPTLGTICADEIFGDQIDKDDESLFLAAMIDESQPLQAELVARLSTVFDMQGLLEPDRYSYQLFKRKAGYSARDKRLPKNIMREPEDQSAPDLLELGEYCMAICLKDYQIVRFGGQEYMLLEEKMTPLFEIRPHIKNKLADRPTVPINRTLLKLGNGKATLKRHDYLSVLVWGFWNGNPSKEDNIKMNTASLQEMIDKMKLLVPDQGTQRLLSPVSEEGIVIYDKQVEDK